MKNIFHFSIIVVIVAVMSTLCTNAHAEPDPRFTDNGNGTITDNKSHLVWDKDANRHGSKTGRSHIRICRKLDKLIGHGKGGPWHLATRAELDSLRGTDPPVINLKSWWYWAQVENWQQLMENNRKCQIEGTTHMRTGEFVGTPPDGGEVETYGWCVREEY